MHKSTSFVLFFPLLVPLSKRVWLDLRLSDPASVLSVSPAVLLSQRDARLCLRFSFLLRLKWQIYFHLLPVTECFSQVVVVLLSIQNAPLLCFMNKIEFQT